MNPPLRAGYLVLIIPGVFWGQSPIQNEAGGTAEIAIQGYYLGGNSQPLTALSGLDISFREFLPKLGLITGNLEGYADSSRGRLGQNSLTIHGLKWRGRRWTITGGDYLFTTAAIKSPFSNYSYPEAGARGVKVEMTDGPRQFTFFTGEETLQSGPRITFRTQVPQFVLGGSVRQRFGSKLRVGLQYLGLSSNDRQVEANQFFFPLGSEFKRTDSVSLQAEYLAESGLTFWADATVSREQFAASALSTRSAPVSSIWGAKWQTKRLTVSANYGSLSRSALPVLGYYFGDRKGPMAEIRYKAFWTLELFGSGVISGNNIEKDPAIATLSTKTFTVGASATLPGDLGVSGQYSKLGLSGELASDASQNQDQHSSQIQITLSKAIHRHQLQLTARNLDLLTTSYLQKQKSAELQDSLQFSRFQVSAALRMQQESGAGQLENSFFARGSVQVRLGKCMIYGQFEKGNDLVNKSLFSTNSVATSVAGVRVPVKYGWTFEAEAFRTTLLTALNPVSILVLQAQGTGVANILDNFNQWSFYARLKRNASWGAPLKNVDLGSNEVVYGSVEGFVYEDGTGPQGRVAGVPVQLDGARTVVTDAAGRYRFGDVPEGAHAVTLEAAELPADLSPGPVSEPLATVRARATTRVDLRVVKAGSSIRGALLGLAAEDQGAVHMENIVIYLSGVGKFDSYTSCDKTGAFAFFNLRAGHYTLTVDRGTLPENYALVSPGEMQADLGSGDSPPLVFRMEKRLKELPVRKVFTEKNEMR